jgi:hypothetical protein
MPGLFPFLTAYSLFPVVLLRLVPAVGEGDGLERGEAFGPGAGLGEGVVPFIGADWGSYAVDSSNSGTAECLIGIKVAEKGLRGGESRLNRGRPAGQILQCGVDCGRRLGSKNQDPRFGAVRQTRLLIVNGPEVKGVPHGAERGGEFLLKGQGGELVVSELK